MPTRHVVFLLLLVSAPTAAVDERIAIEAMGRAAFPACFEDPADAPMALALSDRFLAYLVRYEGHDAGAVAHTVACAQTPQPLPPACFPDGQDILVSLRARNDALNAVVAANTLPTLVRSDIEGLPTMEQCKDVSAFLW